MIRQFVLTIVAALAFVAATAQQRSVSGVVTDGSGHAVVGAAVVISGTQTGTVTDADGRFHMSVDDLQTAVLSVSFLGYETQTVALRGRTYVEVSLGEDALELGDVVVTALGIRRSEKALSYNVQSVSDEQLTTVKSPNFMTSLAGKVAGININASSAGAGGATRVVMRGPKSINQSNQALYVIDGIPMTNSNAGGTGSMYSYNVGTEGIADLNPEDIENVSVLSGPAAAALYGSEAAQGVVMITTKRGREGRASLTVTNNTSFSTPLVLPEFQNEFVNRPGEMRSWGEQGGAGAGRFNPRDFFRTGTSVQSNAALTVGGERSQAYVSVGHTNARGILPTNQYDRYNATARNNTRLLADRLTLETDIQYVNQSHRNMIAQGQYMNPLVALYLFPRGEDFDAVRTYEVYDPVRRVYVQNWGYGDAGLSMQNPYWVLNRMVRTSKKHRFMTSGSLKWQIAPWVDLTGRLRFDRSTTLDEEKRYASTNTLFTGGSPYGLYDYANSVSQDLYLDVLANVNKSWGDVSLGANVGASMQRARSSSHGFRGGLRAPSNVFTPFNIDYGFAQNDNRPIYSEGQHRVNSVFANVETGWRSMLFLTLTGRQDWDSALAGTAEESFFYPSVGLSAVVSEMAPMPAAIDYLKVRGSWASVGTAIPRNIASDTRYGFNTASQRYGTNTYLFPHTFYPERTDSWEAGLTLRMLSNSVSLDATVYQSNTRKQTFLRPITGGMGYSSEYVQTGNVRNRGLELALGYDRQWGDLAWSSKATWSMNRNKIIDLLDDPNEVITQSGNVILKKGGTMGDVYTYNDFLRDREGNIAIDGNGRPLRATLDDPKFLGCVLPKGNLGWSNELSWRGVSLGFLLTARFGGIVMSQTQAILDYYGVSKRSADVRKAGGVPVNLGVMSAENFFEVAGAPANPIWGEYTYDGSNFRLQEAHVSYTLPRELLGGVELTLGLTGNNLLLFYNKAPFDPESTASTGTFYQGFDYFMQPSLRQMGFNVRLKI